MCFFRDGKNALGDGLVFETGATYRCLYMPFDETYMSFLENTAVF